MRVTMQKTREVSRRFPPRAVERGTARTLPAFSAVGVGMLREQPLFVEEVMLPEQYFAQLRQRADFPGEQRLLLAVLEDAVHCFQANLLARSPRRQQAFDEAEEWLLEPEVDAKVTLEYVCDVFGFNVEYLRAGLRQWRDRQREAPRSAADEPTVPGGPRRQPAAPLLRMAV